MRKYIKLGPRKWSSLGSLKFSQILKGVQKFNWAHIFNQGSIIFLSVAFHFSTTSFDLSLLLLLLFLSSEDERLELLPEELLLSEEYDRLRCFFIFLLLFLRLL